MPDSDWDEDPQCATSLAPPPVKRQENHRESAAPPKRTNYEFDNSEFSESMLVDSRFTGLIIGKSGANIKNLQLKSNTNIKINENYSNPGTANIVIKGDPASVKRAKNLILQLTHNRDNPGGAGRNYRQTSGADDKNFNHGDLRTNPDYNSSSDPRVISRNDPRVGGRANPDTNYNPAVDPDYNSSSGPRVISRNDPRISGRANPATNYNPGYNPINNSAGDPRVISRNDPRISGRANPDYGNSNFNRLDTSDNRSNKKYWDFGEINQSANPDYDEAENFDQRPLTRVEGNYVQKGKIDWRAISKESKEKAEEARKELPPVIKDFYKESEEITKMSEEEVQNIRFAKNRITVTDLKNDETRVVPKIITEFRHAFQEYPEIMETVANAKFTHPSPIQCQAWPIIMSGYDLIGIAQTGTGKTLSFLLPALIHIEHQPTPRNQRVGPTCLILSPTRELAVQIHEEVLKFNYKNIRSCCVYGGASRKDQVSTIEQGVEIVIATPGRLNDLIDSGIISMKSVTFLVLDEADRMLDMGFEPDIRKIILLIREDRQTVMTTATWPPAVSRIAKMYQTNPFKINVGSLNLQACENVTQNIEIIDQEDKMDRLKYLLGQADDSEKILIFVGRKLTADHLSVEFNLRRVCSGGIECIHGGREQSDRERVLAAFKTGEARILIATDLASRGLDIHDINVVINYDFPKHIEEYVHRIGRTGRAGRYGTSISFVTRENWGQAQSLIDILTESKQGIPQELHLMAERFKGKQASRDFERGCRDASNKFQSTQGMRLCRTCGKPGHLSRDCNNR